MACSAMTSTYLHCAVLSFLAMPNSLEGTVLSLFSSIFRCQTMTSCKTRTEGCGRFFCDCCCLPACCNSSHDNEQFFIRLLPFCPSLFVFPPLSPPVWHGVVLRRYSIKNIFFVFWHSFQRFLYHQSVIIVCVRFEFVSLINDCACWRKRYHFAF